ncbi:MAG: hypothetical protein AAF579_12165 [Cyanobacteria bacterium P01_C01_bin.118]
MQAVATRARQWAKTSVATATHKSTDMQRMGTRCWRTLIAKGVPSEDARELAIAIVHFIYLGSQPSIRQKDLLGRYYQHVCAANIPALQLA